MRGDWMRVLGLFAFGAVCALFGACCLLSWAAFSVGRGLD